jgi:hypothetical protein
MKKTLCLTILLGSMVAATPATAQSFGEPFAAANTRYDIAIGKPRLAANARDFFLFWSTERKIRATSLAQTAPRAGHVVLDTSGAFDVAWTGEAFLAVSSRRIREDSNDAHIIGRLLDAEARPISDELALAEHGREPQVAAGPEAIVMVYRGTGNDTRVLVLGPRGESTGAPSWKVPLGGTGYAVAGNDDGFMIAISNANELRTITLDRQGRVLSEYVLPRPTNAFRQVALATDGTRFLMVWSNTQDEVAATTVDRNGSFGTPLVIQNVPVPAPTVAWSGTGWSVCYESPHFSVQSGTRVVQLDPAAQRIIATEESGVEGSKNPSVAAVNGRVMAAWNPARGASAVAELPFAANAPRVATYAATQQTLLTAVSSDDATLMIWREQSEDGSSIRSGLRTHAGQWTERELTTGYEAIAASDGEQFVVIVERDSRHELIRLDRKGRTLGSPIVLPGARFAIAWNGTNYAIVSDMNGMLLSPSGVLSAPVAIPNVQPSFNGKLALASNGDGFLLVGEEFDCQFLLCGSSGIYGMRLNAGLQRVEKGDIPIETNPGLLAGVTWNGSEYVVAWRPDNTGIGTARVPAAAGSPVNVARPPTDILARGVASMHDGTIAIVGSTGGLGRVALLENDGSIAQTFDVDGSTMTGTPFLTEVPGGIAYVASSVQDAAPHHGTSHVIMAIARSSITPPPHAPHVHARLINGAVLVDWSASAGTLNGYRLEYQADGGSWNELEEWFAAGSHHRAIRPSFGTDFAIRMRAFNDGGASAYSTPVFTKPIRRRAAR